MFKPTSRKLGCVLKPVVIGCIYLCSLTQVFAERGNSHEAVTRNGSLAAIDDIKMYYEIHGSGEPMVLIHGGFGSVELWDKQVPILSEKFKVITMDCRGRARTTDSDAPISYGRMTNDIVRLFDYLGIDKAHVVGHSDGGIVSLNLLVDYPDRVNSATLIGTPFNRRDYPTAYAQEVRDIMQKLRQGSTDVLGMREKFVNNTGDSRQFTGVINKLEQTWLTQPNFTEAVLNTIQRPVLVVKVDHDNFITPENFDRLANAIPATQVLYIPEGTHGVAVQQADQVAMAIMKFASNIKR